MPIILKALDETLFESFTKKHRISFDKKTNQWNKQFTPVVETIQIDKGRYPSFENIIVGYILGQWIGNKCKYCGKFLENNRAKFCKEQHRKLFHHILKIGKEKFGFEFGMNNHWLLIPTLYEYHTNQKGQWIENKSHKIKRIERKNIEFVINGERHKMTMKSGKPRGS